MKKNLKFILALLLTAAFASPVFAAMPKKGEVAVIAIGMSDYSSEFVHMVEDSVVQELLSAGYRVVDEATKRKIHQAVAQRKADDAYLRGDVNALMKISFGYSVATTIAVRFRVDEAENTIDTGRHKGYTNSVSITFNAKNSGGDYTRASQSPIMTTGAGVTPAKATNRAVIAAAAKIAAALTR
ncbi:MAG: hypothetical protein LBL05_09055 [Synergistaceae bacterium]|nr:hypothetical protein [Synergistaceae bacterium]